MKKQVLLLSVCLVATSLVAQENAIPQRKSNKFESFLAKQNEKQGVEQKNVNRSPQVEYLPQFRENHYPDFNNNTVFNHSSTTNYTYNKDLNVTEELRISASTTTNESKIMYTYDSFGNEIERVTQYWNNNAWENSYKDSQSYNSQNERTQHVSYQWNNNTWEISWGYKDAVTYDGNNNPTKYESQEWVNHLKAFRNSYKTEITYTNNEPTEFKESKWDTTGNQWILSDKYTNLVWHNYSNFEIKNYTGQSYQNGTWVDEEKGSYVYNGSNYVATYEVMDNGSWALDNRETYTETDNFGSYTSLYENYVNGTWENSEKYSNTFDSHFNQTDNFNQEWISGVWQTTYQDNTVYTYDTNGNKLTETYKGWDSQNQTMKNYHKYVYGGYQVMVSVNDITNNTLQVNVFPNPASENITITTEVYPYALSIYNSVGQVVLSTTGVSKQELIDISSFETGVYFIKMDAKEMTQQASFIKK